MRQSRATNWRAVLGAACVLALAGNLMAADFIVESRTGGQHFANYSETGAFSNSGAKSTASGCTSGIGSQYSSLFTGRIAHFSYTAPATGLYDVASTWGNSTNGADHMKYTVNADDGATVYLKNQNQYATGTGANKWTATQNLLGTHPMTAGQTYQVTLEWDGVTPSIGGRIMSDAVKWTGSNCGDTAPVSIRYPVMTGDTVVRVTGVSTSATLVKVYADGSVIGSIAPAGATSVDVPVSPALAGGQVIIPTQVVAGVEGCTIGVPSWTVDAPSQIPAVNVDPEDILVTDATSVRVANVSADATLVKVYSNGVAIGSATAASPKTTVTVSPALTSGALISATQIMQSVGGSGSSLEGAVPTTGVTVDDRGQVPQVRIVGLTAEGQTVLRVLGVTGAPTSPAATTVIVYDGTTEIARNSAPVLDSKGAVIVNVPALVIGHTLKATQVVRLEGNPPTAGRRVTAVGTGVLPSDVPVGVIEDFTDGVVNNDLIDAFHPAVERNWYDEAVVAYGTSFAKTLFGSKCLLVNDNGWANGQYCVYDQIIPVSGTYHLKMEMLVSEPAGSDFDWTTQFQVGVQVNGAHRTATTGIAACEITGEYKGPLTVNQDGVDETAAYVVRTGTFTANAGDSLLIAFATNVTTYNINVTFDPFSYDLGMLVDNITLMSGPKPAECSDIPLVTVVEAPVAAGDTEVSVADVDARSTLVTVYANGVAIGSGAPEGATQVAIPVSALVAGTKITATQTLDMNDSYGAREGCWDVAGPVVGAGANSTLHVALGIRETGGSGPVGADGGSTGNIQFIGATALPGTSGGGTVPLGKALNPGVDWQTVTFSSPASGGTDAVADGPTGGNGAIDGTWGVLEELAFTISAPDYNTGPYVLYIDSIYNGSTLLTNFDDVPAGITAGSAGLMFRLPRYSGTTSANLLTAPDISIVDPTKSADGGTNSVRIEFQYSDAQPKRWLRLTTDGAGSTYSILKNPMIDLTQPVTIKFFLYGPPPCNTPWADVTGPAGAPDHIVDMLDFAAFQRCWLNPAGTPPALAPECMCFDQSSPKDGKINLDDLTKFMNCASGPGIVITTDCPE